MKKIFVGLTKKSKKKKKIEKGVPLTVSLPLDMSEVSEIKGYRSKWQKSIVRFFDRNWMEIFNDLSLFALISLLPFLLFHLLSSGEGGTEDSEKEKSTLSSAAQKVLLLNGNDSSSIFNLFIELTEKGFLKVNDKGIEILKNDVHVELSNGAVALLFVLNSIHNNLNNSPNFIDFPISLSGGHIQMIYESINSELISHNLWNSNLREKISICNSVTFVLSILGLSFLAKNRLFYSIPLFGSAFATCLLPEYFINTRTKMGNHLRNHLLEKENLERENADQKTLESQFSLQYPHFSVNQKIPLGNFYFPFSSNDGRYPKFSFEEGILKKLK